MPYPLEVELSDNPVLFASNCVVVVNTSIQSVGPFGRGFRSDGSGDGEDKIFGEMTGSDVGTWGGWVFVEFEPLEISDRKEVWDVVEGTGVEVLEKF